MPQPKYQYPITNDLLTMTALFGARGSDALKEYGLALNEYRALAYVRQGMANTVTRLSVMLDVAKCKVSCYVAKLCEMGCIAKGRRKGTSYELLVTERGILVFEAARDALTQAFDDILSPLDETQRTLFDMGCRATTTLFDGFRLTEVTPDFVYVYLRSCLLTEQFLTKTTRARGLSLAGFRVLFALLNARTPLTSAEISRITVIPKATISDCLTKFQAQGYVETSRLDGRSRRVALTKQGTVLASLTALDVDRSYMSDVREATPFERELYVTVATAIVSHQRDLMKLQHS